MAFDLQLAICIATVALNLALAIAVGAAKTALWLANGMVAWSVAQARVLQPVRIGASVAALAALGALLPFVSAFMAEVPLAEAGEAMAAMLTESHFGMAWAIGMGALGLAVLASALPASRPWLRTVAMFNLLALAVALYTRSMVSHAAADGDLSLAVVIDWMHLCLICLWMGDVFIAAFGTLGTSVPVQSGDHAEVAKYVEHLSSSATFALAGIVATGVFSAWHNLGSIEGLTDHAYGSVMMCKLALVAIAVLLGGFNRFFVMPSLLAGLRERDAGSSRPLQRFTRILRVEAMVLLAVLVAAAILSATSPPHAG